MTHLRTREGESDVQPVELHDLRAEALARGLELQKKEDDDYGDGADRQVHVCGTIGSAEAIWSYGIHTEEPAPGRVLR